MRWRTASPRSAEPLPRGSSSTSRLGSRLPALGGRGEGWVAGQVVLIALLVVLGLAGPPWPSGAAVGLIVAGAVLGAAGLVLLAGGAVTLGSALTPMPHPRDDTALRQDGVYGLCRHPMYGGALLMATGWALATSPLVLVAVLLAAGFLEVKSLREEAWLEEQFPEYAGYRDRVRGRLIPRLH